jgi:membrane-associated phospholipid phosphatase
MVKLRRSSRGTPRRHVVSSTGRLSVHEVFPPRVALARGKSAIVVVAAALSIFAVIFTLVQRNRSASFDLKVTRRLQKQNQPWFSKLMQIVSWPGFPPQSRIIPPALAAAMLVLGFPLEALFQLAAWGAGGISSVIKRVMRRSRPSSEEVRVLPARIGGSSFPSGHVLIYTGVYGFLAFLIETLVRSNKIRRAAVGALVSLIALVGPSRIYLGHHWFTDVMASYLLGGSYLLALTALYRRFKTDWLNRRYETLRQERGI